MPGIPEELRSCGGERDQPRTLTTVWGSKDGTRGELPGRRSSPGPRVQGISVMMSFLLLLFAAGIFSTGADPCVIPEGAQNVALTGKATQSSLHASSGVANHAIDGNTDTDYTKGSCSHTNNDLSPWWKVDFGNSKSIGVVKIFNRADCFSERLSGAIITLGNSLDHTKNYVCGTIKDAFESKLTICCNGKSGQYLAIYVPHSGYLTLCEVQAFLNPCTIEAQNVALTGEATQSSVFDSSGVANHAIDGNTDTDYSKGSCTHTSTEPSPWWKVDLGNSKSIGVVNIWNRKDCCPERLSGAIITLGDSVDHTQNAVCGTIKDVSESKLTIYCYGKSGRYLTIYLPHSGYVTVCEVQAFLNPCAIPEGAQNVALTGKATQSSVFDSSGVANHGIDGNTDTDYNKGSCTRTNNDPNPWWKVDFGNSKSIGVVKIFNRWDCCSERLSGAIITLGNSVDHTKNAVCGTIDDVSKPKLTIYCNGKSGQYLAIYLPHSGYVTVCEVQAFLNPCVIPDGAQNVALTGKATQSSLIANSGVASHAIDGNTDSDYSKGSCSHTSTEPSPWWKVDLGNSKSIGVVKIFNRADCCSVRLSGAIITLGNSLDHTKNAVCGTINVVSESKLTICCNGKSGQYLAIYLPHSGYLTLCEVQAFTV